MFHSVLIISLKVLYISIWAGHYSEQSGKLNNLCFLTGYRALIGQITFFMLGSYLEIPKGHVTAYVIICSPQKLKVDKFRI